MGMTRIKPSRIVSETTLSATQIGKLPTATAEGESFTLEVTGLPVRGLIHRVSLFMAKAAEWDDTAVAGGMAIHTSGTADLDSTTGLGETDLKSIIALGDVHPYSANGKNVWTLDIGELPTGTICHMCHLVVNLGNSPYNTGTQNPVSPMYYDVSGGVLGPDANDGKLYFTQIGKGTLDFTTVEYWKRRVEIEPCY